MSRLAQSEDEHNIRLEALASKLQTLRSVTNDIHTQAQDTSVLDSLTNSMSNLFTSLKRSSTHLTRSVSAGHPIMRTVGLALLLVFILYSLWMFV